jgi:ABC-type glycerol-3-phosphate transport system substrate-binding protein
MTEHDITSRLAALLSEARDAVPAEPDFVGRTRRRYVRARRRRACVLAVACAAVLLGSSALVNLGLRPAANQATTPTGGPTAAADPVRLWTLYSPATFALRECVDDFNSTSDADVELTAHATEPYRQQLKDGLGSGDGPDIFFHWGGGGLAELVREHQVLDLTDALRARPEVTGAFVPEILAGGRVDGRQFALPLSGRQPVVLFYNRAVFANANLRPPETYDDLLSLVDAFQARGITPLALAGADGWPQLMYLMYLVDRIGGPRVFADIAAGVPDAWSHPAVLRAAKLSRQLADRGAFGAGFNADSYDDPRFSQRLASGQAAMQLMGAWEYGVQLDLNPGFVEDGDLGWVPFPTVAGGVGDPANVVGQPGNYFSVAAGSARPDLAVDFLARTLPSPRYTAGLLRRGEAPAVNEVRGRAETPGGKFVGATRRLVVDAPSFTLAWDQALSPPTGMALNANLRRLFAGQDDEADFVRAMDGMK